jgi:hypothetical protein
MERSTCMAGAWTKSVSSKLSVTHAMTAQSKDTFGSNESL